MVTGSTTKVNSLHEMDDLIPGCSRPGCNAEQSHRPKGPSIKDVRRDGGGVWTNADREEEG